MKIFDNLCVGARKRGLRRCGLVTVGEEIEATLHAGTAPDVTAASYARGMEPWMSRLKTCRREALRLTGMVRG